MAYTTINKQSAHFNSKLWTGNYQSHAITGVGFQPDLVWIKERSSTSSHRLMDSVRGVGKGLSSDNNTAEESLAALLTSFDSDGFTVGADNGVNQNNQTYVSWNWKAAGSSSSNSNGSVTSTVSANTTSGFSIVKWTGTGANATIGHGLGVVPKMIIVKDTDANDNWNVYHASIGNDSHLHLNLTNNASGSSTYWQDYTPTNSIFYIGSDPAINASGNEFIAYCFADITGFSKFGKFTSKGDDDGVFVNTGFAPQLVMLKPLVSDTWSNWYAFDNVRRDYNLNDKPLYWNLTTQEAYYGGSPASNYAQIDILSNGFKIRRDGNWGPGGSNQASVYMAFGQTLVGSNNVPVVAR